MNITFFVLTIMGSRKSALRLKRFQNSILALPCHDRIATKIVQVTTGHQLKSALFAMEKARRFHIKNGGIVGFAEDDTLFHPQFCSELARTVASLPPSWGVLHLCPGFAWGRQFQDHEHRPVEFRPERPFKKGLSPRFWNGPPAENAWLGGPIAYIVKSVGFWNPIMAHMRAGMGILDIDLTLNALKFPGRDMVARDPQLCKEIDRGQSVRLNGP